MARPVNADAEATKTRIITAASHAFATDGVIGASLRRIADDAGISLGLIRHHFGNKDSLYDACIESSYLLMAQLTPELEERFNTNDAIEDVIAHLMRIAYRAVLAHRDTIQLLTEDLIRPTPNRSQGGPTALIRFIELVCQRFGEATSRPAESFRLPIRTLIMLICRYALVNPNEIAMLHGIADTTTEMTTTVHDIVEQHLVEVALALLVN